MECSSGITPFDIQSGAFFGASVSIFDKYICIGASNHRTEGDLNRGKAYVFSLEGEQYVQSATMISSNGKAEDLFGAAVAINPEMVLVGAPGYDDPNLSDPEFPLPNVGKVYHFR